MYKNIFFSNNSGEFMRGMAESSQIIGVYYTDSDEYLEKLKINLSESCKKISNKHKTEIEVLFKPFHSPTINTINESDNILNAATKIYGSHKVIKLEKSKIAAEDFSEYLRYVPGCFFLVGAGESAGPVHTNQFQFNDNIISAAANVICYAVIDSLNI